MNGQGGEGGPCQVPQIKTFSCRKTEIQKYKNLEIQKKQMKYRTFPSGTN